jgi:threonine aldolase
MTQQHDFLVEETNMDNVIDLRSDTVTRPSPEIRQAIAAAPVGDDQFGEDPTINRLQDRIASLLGKEAALWLPTGTIANQVALATVQTNILVFHLSADAPDAPTVVARARERGLLVFAFGPRTIRAVTHLDVSQEECARAADLLLAIVNQGW